MQAGLRLVARSWLCTAGKGPQQFGKMQPMKSGNARQERQEHVTKAVKAGRQKKEKQEGASSEEPQLMWVRSNMAQQSGRAAEPQSGSCAQPTVFPPKKMIRARQCLHANALHCDWACCSGCSPPPALPAPSPQSHSASLSSSSLHSPNWRCRWKMQHSAVLWENERCELGKTDGGSCDTAGAAHHACSWHIGWHLAPQWLRHPLACPRQPQVPGLPCTQPAAQQTHCLTSSCS